MTNPSSVKLIISGGQSGADLAGNEFAKEIGIPTRCYVFEKFHPVNMADEDVLKRFERINIKVEREWDYIDCLRQRTIFNVKRADATVIFLSIPLHKLGSFSGSRLTWKICEYTKKPFVLAYIGDWPESVRLAKELIQDQQPTILNIAGQRTLDRKVVKSLLKDVWRKLKP